jgi:FkbM family methyltransferase
MRWIGNHVVPWAARSAFRAGVSEVNGVLLEVPRPSDWGGGGEFHMALGTYEKAEMRFLLSRLQPGQTFVDVGSHIGYVALPVARVLGRDGRVFCFEPTPATFDRLSANVERNRLTNVTLVPAAAADRDGEAILACSDDSVMWNSLARGGARGVHVATRSVDSVLAEAGWPEVAGLKIDAEGAEWEVLCGAEGALARNANAFLMVEVDGRERRRESLRLLRFLVSRGYRLSRFTWSGPQPESLASLERRLSTNSRPWANVLAESSAGS